MGERDIESLNKIYRFANDFCKLAGLPYKFEEDSGRYQTAIIFNEETKSYRKPRAEETWNDIKYPETMICPDIADYEHKILMEYEEEGQKKRPGARLATKGHGREGDHANKRDSRRNQFYIENNFQLLPIWESQLKSETAWKIRIVEFLIQHFKSLEVAK